MRLRPPPPACRSHCSSTRCGPSTAARLLDERGDPPPAVATSRTAPPSAGRSTRTPASSSRAPTAGPSCRPSSSTGCAPTTRCCWRGGARREHDRRLRTPLPGGPGPVAVRHLAVRAAALRRHGRLPAAAAVPAGLRTGLLGGRAVPAACARAATHLVAWDGAPTVVEVARERLAGTANVDLAVGAIPGDWPCGTFDLVVLSEIGYYFARRRAARDIAAARRRLARSRRHADRHPLAGPLRRPRAPRRRSPRHPRRGVRPGSCRRLPRPGLPRRLVDPQVTLDRFAVVVPARDEAANDHRVRGVDPAVGGGGGIGSRPLRARRRRRLLHRRHGRHRPASGRRARCRRRGARRVRRAGSGDRDVARAGPVGRSTVHGVDRAHRR